MDYSQLKIDDYLALYGINNDTPEDSFLKLYLGFIKNYLEGKGLIFSTGEVATFGRFALNTRQTIFTIPLVKKDSLDKITYINKDKEEILEFLTDYTLEGKKSGYFKSIRLLNKTRVFYPDIYLKLEGTFGFDTMPEDLHFAFLNMFADLLNNHKLNLSKLEADGRDVSSLRAGNITYNFGSQNQASKSMNFSQIFAKDTNLKQIINGYL